MSTAETTAHHGRDEEMTVHVLWVTGGLGCDGESVAMTGATNPSIEDILLGSIPGLPTVAFHNHMLAVESGEDFIQHFLDAENGLAFPYILVVEGAVGNEEINGDGYWSGFGVNPFDGQPITVNEWIDRLAPKASAILAVGTCATYGGIPAMRGNPTGAMGVPDYLGWKRRTRGGLPIVCLPGCPSQPDNITQILLQLVWYVAGRGPAPELDEQLRPVEMFGRTTREGCNRAGFTEQGKFATTHGDDQRCLVQLGCKGPVVKCNVPLRGWMGGVGGCPNVGGICIGCTMPGFPDRYVPFHDPDVWGATAANFQRFTYGPVFRFFRKLNLEKKFDREPDWRRTGKELRTGYTPDW
ncbi:hydrogenase expression protein HypE [Paraconexibacter sp.]|uniref:NADH-quinone oxidoreductase subunit B family protein n=1 Tax=Paraconexibacter sp. TaxID=2949640 RepID=UPI0035675B8E